MNLIKLGLGLSGLFLFCDLVSNANLLKIFVITGQRAGSGGIREKDKGSWIQGYVC